MAQSSSRVLGLSRLLEEHWSNIVHRKRLNDSNALERSDAGSIPAASTNFTNEMNLSVQGMRATRVRMILHQGPAGAEPTFDPAEVTVEPDAGSGEGAAQAQWGEASTRATFSEPGDYVIRIRVDNFAAEDSGFDYVCCWSNAYVPVTVR